MWYLWYAVHRHDTETLKRDAVHVKTTSGEPCGSFYLFNHCSVYTSYGLGNIDVQELLEHQCGRNVGWDVDRNPHRSRTTQQVSYFWWWVLPHGEWSHTTAIPTNLASKHERTSQGVKDVFFIDQRVRHSHCLSILSVVFILFTTWPYWDKIFGINQHYLLNRGSRVAVKNSSDNQAISALRVISVV